MKAYTAATTNASDTVTATAAFAEDDVTISIKNGSADVTSGEATTWESGSNTLTVTVDNATQHTSKTYTVTVTKS